MLRLALEECTARKFTVGEVSVDQHGEDRGARTVTVWLVVQGAGSVNELVTALADIDGVRTVAGDDANTLAV